MTSGSRRPPQAGRRWLSPRARCQRKRLTFGDNNMRCTLVMVGIRAFVQAAGFQPVNPRPWADAAMATLELSNARPKYLLRFVSSDYDYRMPVRLISELPPCT